MYKEKKIYTKGQPQKIVCGIVNFGLTKLSKPTWYCSYCSKLKKKRKKKRQSDSTKWYCRCTVKNTGCTVIYIKGKKSTDRWPKKKKKVVTVATAPLGIVATVPTVRKLKKKKKKTKWLTKMEL